MSVGGTTESRDEEFERSECPMLCHNTKKSPNWQDVDHASHPSIGSTCMALMPVG